MTREKNGHGTYFMEKVLYSVVRSDAVSEGPLNMLTSNEWFSVLHHVNAHNIEGVSSRGNLAEVLLGDNTDRFCLYQVAVDYMSENNNGELVPESERELCGKVRAFLDEANKSYQLVNVSKNSERVVWDLISKKSA